MLLFIKQVQLSEDINNNNYIYKAVFVKQINDSSGLNFIGWYGYSINQDSLWLLTLYCQASTPQSSISVSSTALHEFLAFISVKKRNGKLAKFCKYFLWK